MRYSDDNYQVGEVWLEEETGERFVCIDLKLCEDGYYDEIYVISEEEFLENMEFKIVEDDLESYDVISSDNFGDYERVNNERYSVESETIYKFGRIS